MSKLTKAVLLSRSTLDGWDILHDDVPIGKVYWIDLSSVQIMKHRHSNHIGVVDRQCVWAYDSPEDSEGGWMIMELLKVQAN